jgi:hypothetical protein
MTPLDRVITIIREELMSANPVGQGGGFGADSKDPRAGFDPVMGLLKRKSGLIDRRGKKYKTQYASWLRSSGLL